MALQNITLDGRQYVLVPRKQWDSLSSKLPIKDHGEIPMPPARLDGNYTLEHVRISLANKMTARRKGAGLTQVRLARLAGVRVETISRLENGLHMPGTKTFGKIDRALKRVEKRPAA